MNALCCARRPADPLRTPAFEPSDWAEVLLRRADEERRLAAFAAPAGASELAVRQHDQADLTGPEANGFAGACDHGELEALAVRQLQRCIVPGLIGMGDSDQLDDSGDGFATFKAASQELVEELLALG